VGALRRGNVLARYTCREEMVGAEYESQPTFILQLVVIRGSRCLLLGSTKGVISAQFDRDPDAGASHLRTAQAFNYRTIDGTRPSQGGARARGIPQGHKMVETPGWQESLVREVRDAHTDLRRKRASGCHSIRVWYFSLG
jgi:hypothetical protein